MNTMFNNSTFYFYQPEYETDQNSECGPFSKCYNITWTVAYCLQFFSAMIGNFLIVWIVYRDSRLKTTTNYLIANMAVSDLIGGLFAYPLAITLINFDGQWLIGGDFGNALCKITYFTAEMSFSVSIYSCIAIAIDRYFGVVHPFKRPLEGKMKEVIAVIWIIAAVFNSPYLYLVETYEGVDKLYCTASDKNWSSYTLYLTYKLVFEIALPVVFIAIIYTLTICKLFRHKVPGLPTSERRRREQQNKKVLRQTVTIVVLLFLCRIYHITVMFLLLNGKLDHLSLSQLKILIVASLFILNFSFVYNFFVYLIFNDIYHENIKALIPKCYCRSNGNRRQEIPAEGEMIEM